ncbi:MAG TPA: GH32 C-terminal domain-containing protein, partial [Prolixibacteraceae bacterium]|nr:GH32 C-terminal domain-containing protein [Prolixibacteraceae bacterium]
TDKKNPGAEVVYNVKRGTLTVLNSTLPLMPIDNKIYLEILLDRSSVEIFANNGQAVISNCFTPVENATGIKLFTIGGELGVKNLTIHKIESVWRD